MLISGTSRSSSAKDDENEEETGNLHFVIGDSQWIIYDGWFTKPTGMRLEKFKGQQLDSSSYHILSFNSNGRIELRQVLSKELEKSMKYTSFFLTELSSFSVNSKHLLSVKIKGNVLQYGMLVAVFNFEIQYETCFVGNSMTLTPTKSVTIHSDIDKEFISLIYPL